MSFNHEQVRKFYQDPHLAKINDISKRLAAIETDNIEIKTDDIVARGDSARSHIRIDDKHANLKKYNNSQNPPLLINEPDYDKLTLHLKFHSSGNTLYDYSGFNNTTVIQNEPCPTTGIDQGFWGGSHHSAAHRNNATEEINYEVTDNSNIRISSTDYVSYVMFCNFKSMQNMIQMEKYDDADNQVKITTENDGQLKFIIEKANTQYKWRTSSGNVVPNTDYILVFTSDLQSSLQFDGVNDIVDCGNHSDLWSQSLTKFSFSVWIYPTAGADGNDRAVVWKTLDLANGFACMIDPSVSNRINFHVRIGSSTFTAFSTALTLNKWNHIICSYDNTLGSANVRIYVNGVIGTSANQTGTITDAGFGLELGGSGNDYKGNMKDFRFWKSTSINTTEATDLYETGENPDTPDYWIMINEGTGTSLDDLQSSKTATVTGAVWLRVPDFHIYINNVDINLVSSSEGFTTNTGDLNMNIGSGTTDNEYSDFNFLQEFRMYKRVLHKAHVRNLWTNKVSISNVPFGRAAIFDTCVIAQEPIGDSFTSTSFTTTSFS